MLEARLKREPILIWVKPESVIKNDFPSINAKLFVVKTAELAPFRPISSMKVQLELRGQNGSGRSKEQKCLELLINQK